MTKKQATKQAKARGKPSEPTKPKRKTGGGGADRKEPESITIGSAGGKKSAMVPLADESVEERLARLWSELPEGYLIIDTSECEVFGDSHESEAEASTALPENKAPSEKKLHPYYGMRTAFEADKRWIERVPRSTTLIPSPFLKSENEPISLARQVKEMRRGVEATKLLLWGLILTAEKGENSIRNTAGRALAELLSLILDHWPEKRTYQTCVKARIRGIKKTNGGFIQRWNKELHRGGVPKKRKSKDQPLEKFVRDGESRLDSLADEVIHAMLGGEHPLALREAGVLAKWMKGITGLEERVKAAKRKHFNLVASMEIKQMVNDAKLADVEGYFFQVFKPALQNGLWHKLDYIGSRKFGDYQGVMITMLRAELVAMGW